MNVIILSKNYEQYTSGYYHQDIIDSFCKLTNTYLYGYGYSDYNSEDSIEDVIAKSPFDKSNIDLIVCSTSWDEDGSLETVDPHPNIELLLIKDIPKVYFLNKEYKKLDLRFEYIKKQKFDLVCTVHPDAKKWEKQIGVKFLHLPFGISLERFKDFGLKKEYDFSFTGGLHKSHTDMRYKVKQQVFDKKYLNRLSTHGLDALFKPNPLKEKFQKYKIFWAEWGAKNYLFQSLLPKGKKYAELMNQSKVFLNTPSAIGIFNTRFFELMATKSLILCPKSDQYMDILKDGYNCVMFNPNMSDFDEKLIYAIENENFRNQIVENAYKDVKNHSYDVRINTLLDYING
jgi:spore maturation protein CgeB